MRIVYLTTYDALDQQNFSGAATFMARTFQKQGVDLHLVGDLRVPPQPLLIAKRLLYSRLLGRRYLIDRSPRRLRSLARAASRRLDSVDASVLLSPGSLPVACLETRYPVVFWTDATFAGMVDYYPNYTGLCRETVREGHRMEQAALDRCALAVYSSEWAAQTALQCYRAAPDKVKVVPFGANLHYAPSFDEVEAALELRPQNSCNLLFIGGSAHRKGADIAVQIAVELNRRGLQTELTLVGGSPGPDCLPHFVHWLGYIDKRTQAGYRQFERLLTGSHFLLGPSRADCTPIAFCEANAFGVPCLARDTGGVSSVIRDGVNGYMFASDAPVSEYSDRVLSLMRDRPRYRGLALSAHEHYQTRLNWDTSVGIVLRYIQAMQLGNQAGYRPGG
jgi:glycosyltransferase involved in cell wall biosynthesis